MDQVDSSRQAEGDGVGAISDGLSDLTLQAYQAQSGGRRRSSLDVAAKSPMSSVLPSADELASLRATAEKAQSNPSLHHSDSSSSIDSDVMSEAEEAAMRSAVRSRPGRRGSLDTQMDNLAGNKESAAPSRSVIMSWLTTRQGSSVMTGRSFGTISEDEEASSEPPMPTATPSNISSTSAKLLQRFSNRDLNAVTPSNW